MAGARPILVVEDDTLIGQVIQATLEDAGYEVVWHELGRDALAAALTLKPACVLLDLMLPDMDGQEVLRGLKANPETDQIPVIVVSAVSSSLKPDELALVQSVVPKPFTIDTLIEAVRAAERARLRGRDL
jgi:DNA-binding response OmpR family regulator